MELEQVNYFLGASTIRRRMKPSPLFQTPEYKIDKKTWVTDWG